MDDPDAQLELTIVGHGQVIGASIELGGYLGRRSDTVFLVRQVLGVPFSTTEVVVGIPFGRFGR